jgi:hypothetical protein
MALYLQTDGVDDNLKTPSISFTKIVMDALIEHKTATAQMYVDYRPGIGFTNFLRATTDKDQFPGINSVKIDGVSKTNDTQFIPSNTRFIAELEDSLGTGAITIFAHNNGSQCTKGKIYDIKFYNGATLVAHYDMTTGTVQDQSGNGRHATLTGGTWLDDGTGGGTAEPIDAGDVAISASSALTAQADRVLTANSELQASSLLSASANRILTGDGNFTANSNLTAFANRILNADSILNASTSLTAEGEVISLELSVTMSASSSLTAQATKILNGETQLVAGSNLTAEGEVVTLELSVNMSATAGLQASGSRVVIGDVILSAHGEVLASGTAIYDGEAVFIATGNIDPIVLDYSNYRQVISFDIAINLRDFTDLNIALRQKFNLDI